MAGQSRKETAWKKSRKFGDVKGGRMRPKLADNIFKRAHSLKTPTEGQDLPIVLHENPSRDFFFPVTPDQVIGVLQQLPTKDVEGLTHLWFRRMRKRDWTEGTRPMAEFVRGSGVRALTFYPWPVERRLYFGKKRPHGKAFNWYQQWAKDLIQEKGEWWLTWDDEGLTKFYIEGLLLAVVGYNVDLSHRRGSKANQKNTFEFAEQYAVQWRTSDTFVWSDEQ